MASKVSEWLLTLDGHVVVDDAAAREDFTRMTGHVAGWPTHSVAEANATVGSFKGLVHPIEGPATDRVAYGWEIAEWAAQQFAPAWPLPPMIGRGSRFRAAVQVVGKAGF